MKKSTFDHVFVRMASAAATKSRTITPLFLTMCSNADSCSGHSSDESPDFSPEKSIERDDTMPLVQAKCTNCGATLSVENTKDAAVCPYCNTPYIVEKAINNFNTVNNITAGTMNIFGGNVADFVIRAGTLIKYNGASTSVVIPNSVMEIGCAAFNGCANLTNLSLPKQLKGIGEHAFAGCGMTSVIIPAGVSILKTGVFSCCRNLTTVTIPDSVERIDLSYFYHDERDCFWLPSFWKCPITTVHASEDWKRKHWQAFDCLKEYASPPSQASRLSTNSSAGRKTGKCWGAWWTD